MQFEYNQDKNTKLIAERKIGFEEVIEAFNQGKILKISPHYNQKKYPNQKVFYVELKGEIYVVPFLQKDAKTIFLKTIFPSRKARKILLQKSL
ncbi:MAG: hypothetical protein EBS06_00465 [Proteobacteria bacterium]|nr:hypothetical protein [Pseudomonadota bacterium]